LNRVLPVGKVRIKDIIFNVSDNATGNKELSSPKLRKGVFFFG